jgi:hypothetical protein
VEFGLDDLEVPEAKTRGEDTEDAYLRSETCDPGVGCFVRIFGAVNDDPVRLSLKVKKAPVKRSNLNSTAGKILNLCDQALSNEILKSGRTGDDVASQSNQREQNERTSQAQRKMAKEEPAQTARHGARRWCRRIGHF